MNSLFYSVSFALSFFYKLSLLSSDFDPSDIALHKKKIIEEILSTPSKTQGLPYQLTRAIYIINQDDSDYIPKVDGAGEIFNDGETSYQLMHNGTKIIFNSYYNIDWITDVITALRGHHEPQEEKCFYEVLKYIPEGATMIELGAYWGYYSLWFSETVKNAKNYLVEPDLHRLNTGKANFLLNGKKAVFVQGYLGIKADSDPDYTNAPKISLDAFLEDQCIDHVNILHADIQGAEYEMLLSCAESIRRKVIDYFFISTHVSGYANPDDIHHKCINFLVERGYDILAEDNCSPKGFSDGIICARRCDILGPQKIEIKKY